jgi:hypothetical protein
MNNSIEHILSVNARGKSGTINSEIPQSIANSNTFKLAVVVDVIIDENHPVFEKDKVSIKPNLLPSNYKASDSTIKNAESVPKYTDVDYSYIGRSKVRILGLDDKTPVSKLPWAIPLDKSVSQYPLINESVMILIVGENVYYTKPFNTFNFTGANADFSIEASSGLNSLGAIPFNNNPSLKSYTSHPSIARNGNNIGFLGNYFILNPFIRGVKSYEGDTIIESRFGQSIKFSAYDESRINDNWTSNGRDQFELDTTDNQIDFGYSSYMLNKNMFSESSLGGYGNPKITIRNRQRNLSIDRPQKLHPRLPEIPIITEKEKNYGGLIKEDINNDGSTIEISSGGTVTEWVTTVYKSTFAINSEEQKSFSPEGSTTFEIPIYNGDQTIINSDRLIFSSRFRESLHFSKKRYAITTDSEYTVDANDQIVMSTNYLTCFNSPQIFLGQYGDTNEPALLGQTTVDWLYDLCNWLLDHVHWYHHVHPHPHSHPDAGNVDRVNTNDAVPDQTQIPVQQEQLKLLRDNLHRTLSRRIFLTGGGYSKGSNGVKPIGSGSECIDPLIINTLTGENVVGTFKGRNRREGPLKL